MHFICPKCDRPLTKEKSWHYCRQVSIESLFVGKPKELVSVFDKLLAAAMSWEGVSASATKSCIVFIAAKTFLVVKVMKQELDLKFVLPEASEDFPIYKRASYGKKMEHYIRLKDEDDWDADVIGLVKKSYEMMRR
jgi:hypothetical protein